jgi:hypothetical protein
LDTPPAFVAITGIPTAIASATHIGAVFSIEDKIILTQDNEIMNMEYLVDKFLD